MNAAGKNQQARRGGQVKSAAELFARAHEMELDAEARYLELADQMEVHNNPAVAAMFCGFAREEKKHAGEIAARMQEMGIVAETEPEFDWQWPESPETVDPLDVHYRMTTYHALVLALAGEKRAFEFFDEISREGNSAEIRRWAGEFAQEEARHMRYIENALRQEKRPDDDWAEDFDVPAIQE